MTLHYIAGEFSSLLAELRPAAEDSLRHEVDLLRRHVEDGPLRALPLLAAEALELSDTICWLTLEQGDLDGFRRCSATAVALADFTAGASLLP